MSNTTTEPDSRGMAGQRSGDSPQVTVGAPEEQPSQVVTISKSPMRIALTRLRKDRVAMISLGVTLLFVLIAVFAPLLASLEGQDYQTNHFDLIDDNGLPTIGPTWQHWFGVEPRVGRDIFARWVYGARPSFEVAGFATITTTIIGVVMGLIAGYFGGRIDSVISWLINFVLSLPYLIFAIALPAVFISVIYGSTERATNEQVATVRFYSLVTVLTIFGWAGLARLIRGQVMSLRERDFIAAAKVLGVPTWRILGKELLPNLVAPIVVSASLSLPGYVSAEAGLSLLGVGLMEPTPSWGLTIAAAENYYKVLPAFLWVPVAGVTILVLALSILGDSVRDAFDPKTR